MVRRLLDVYEDYTFTDIDTARKRKKRVYKGLEFGGKAHILDVDEISNKIWILDEKYAKKLPLRTAGKIWYLEIFLF